MFLLFFLTKRCLRIIVHYLIIKWPRILDPLSRKPLYVWRISSHRNIKYLGADTATDTECFRNPSDFSIWGCFYAQFSWIEKGKGHFLGLGETTVYVYEWKLRFTHTHSNHGARFFAFLTTSLRFTPVATDNSDTSEFVLSLLLLLIESHRDSRSLEKNSPENDKMARVQ